MPHLSEKHGVYKVGICCVVVGFVAFVIAFTMPTWEQTTHDDSDEVFNSGLWQHTCSGILNCQSYPVISTDPLFQTSRSLACVSLVFYCMALFLIVLHNCTSYGRNVQTENKLVSYLPLVAALVGGSSCGTYIPIGSQQRGLYWAFLVGAIGNIFSLFGSILMLLGSWIDGQRIIRSMKRSQPVFQQPTTQTPVSENLALVAIPVSLLSSHINGSQTNLSIAGVIPVVPAETPKYTSSSLVQSQSPSAAGDSAVSTVPDAPRLDPTAPPPESYDLYY